MFARVALCLVVLAGCVSSGSGTPHANRPNIVFLLTDDMNLADIDYMPNVKSLLADAGVSFDNYYVSTSLCCPSRATNLRGQYAHSTGVESNGPTNGGFETFHLSDEQSTIGTWLQAASYRTALIGKYLNGYPNTVTRKFVPPGWDEWDSPAIGDPYQEFNYSLNQNGKLIHYGSDAADYGTDVYMRLATDFIQQSSKSGQPFFLYLNAYAPHEPATPAPADAALFPDAQVPRTPSFNEDDVSLKPAWIQRLPKLTDEDIASDDALFQKRLQSLQAVDRGVAALIGELKKDNALSNTYFVFSSDNGFHLGQHRMLPGKTTAYEMDIHMPLIIRGPGVTPGARSAALVGNIDLAPTLAEMAGAKVPDFVEGRSLTRLIRDPTSEWTRHAYLLERLGFSTRDAGSEAAPVEPPDNAGEGAANQAPSGSDLPLGVPPLFIGLRSKGFVYVEWATGETELYDVGADPEELHNLAGRSDEQPLVSQFHAALIPLKDCQGQDCASLEDVSLP